jgi:hypothetical protein
MFFAWQLNFWHNPGLFYCLPCLHLQSIKKPIATTASNDDDGSSSSSREKEGRKQTFMSIYQLTVINLLFLFHSQFCDFSSSSQKKRVKERREVTLNARMRRERNGYCTCTFLGYNHQCTFKSEKNIFHVELAVGTKWRGYSDKFF